MYAYGLAAAEAGVNHVGSSATVFHMRYYHPHGALAASVTDTVSACASGHVGML